MLDTENECIRNFYLLASPSNTENNNTKTARIRNSKYNKFRKLMVNIIITVIITTAYWVYWVRELLHLGQIILNVRGSSQS